MTKFEAVEIKRSRWRLIFAVVIEAAASSAMVGLLVADSDPLTYMDSLGIGGVICFGILALLDLKALFSRSPGIQLSQYEKVVVHLQ